MPTSPTDSPSPQRLANRRGILAMSLSMACFIANDAMVKLVSQSLPGAQLIFIRGVFATVLLIGVTTAMGAWRTAPGEPAPWQHLSQRSVLLRAFFDATASMTYLFALFHLQLGIATAINMATPLVITVMAIVLLGERVSMARWLAIAVGFTGVLLVVQPSPAGVNGWALVCLAGTLLHASRDFTTRLIPRSVPSILITLSTAVAVSLLSGVASIFEGWKPADARQIGLLATASVFLSAGYYLLTAAMRGGEMSVIAPFRYTGLLFALTLGWLLWGDIPNALAWAGIGLLVAAGLYMLHSERQRAHAELDAGE